MLVNMASYGTYSWVVFTIALAWCASARTEEPTNAAEGPLRLHGTWRIERLVFPGREREDAKGALVKFEGETMTIHWRSNGDPDKFRFVLNEKRLPATIDLISLGPAYGGGEAMRQLGIDRIRDNRLELCLAGEVRPKEFAAPALGGINTEPSGPSFFVLERVD